MAMRLSTILVVSDLDVFGAFLKFAGRFPLLSALEEVAIAKQIVAGRTASASLAEDPKHSDYLELARIASQGEQARLRFIYSNLRLVVMLARRYTTGELELIDVIQLGNLGLIKAVDKFDWHRGYRFSTHATWWIRQSIGVGIEQTAGIIRVPRQAREELNQVWSAIRKNETAYSSLTLDELSVLTGMTPDRIMRILKYPQDVLSLEAPTFDGRPLQDLISDSSLESPEEGVERLGETRAVQECLKTLPIIDQEILSRRFGLGGYEPHSMKDMSAALDMTVPAAARVLNIALEEMSRLLVDSFNE